MDWIRLLKAILIFSAGVLELCIFAVASGDDDDGATIVCRGIAAIEIVVILITIIYMLIGWERRWYNESNKHTAYSLVYILMDFT